MLCGRTSAQFHRVDSVRLPSWRAFHQDRPRTDDWRLTTERLRTHFSFGNLTELSISFLRCLIYVFIGWIAFRVIRGERSYAFFACAFLRGQLAQRSDVGWYCPSPGELWPTELLLLKIYSHPSSLEPFQVWRKVCYFFFNVQNKT